MSAHFDVIIDYGGKRAKVAQNDKKMCLSCLISEKHKCKMIVPAGIIFIFQNFYFLVKVKVQKMAQNVKKHNPLHFISQEPYVI